MYTSPYLFIRACHWIPLLLLISSLASCQQKTSSENPNAAVPDIDIHTAVVTGNTEAVKMHLKAGTPVDTADPYGGSSPLISAAVFGKPQIARLLLDAGANVNFKNKEGSTALHAAAFFCRTEVVDMLLAAGADKTVKNQYGATPCQSVSGSFEEAKPMYEMMEKMLAPMGLKLDYTQLQQTRPLLAQRLK